MGQFLLHAYLGVAEVAFLHGDVGIHFVIHLEEFVVQCLQCLAILVSGVVAQCFLCECYALAALHEHRCVVEPLHILACVASELCLYCLVESGELVCRHILAIVVDECRHHVLVEVGVPFGAVVGEFVVAFASLCSAVTHHVGNGECA